MGQKAEERQPQAQVVMITGSNRGIGFGLVSKYLKNGYKVIAACRSPDKANDLRKLIDDNDTAGSFIVQLDIDSERSVMEAFEFVSAKVKVLDILINNAGIGAKNHPYDPVLKVDPSEMLKVYRVNVIGTWRVTTTFLPLLRNRAAKVLILSSDLASLTNNGLTNSIGQAGGGITSYRCSKAAVNMLVRNFAMEVPDVTFLAISPGWVATDMGASGGRKPPLTIAESAERIARMEGVLRKKDSGAFWTAKFKEQEKWALPF